MGQVGREEDEPASLPPSPLHPTPQALQGQLPWGALGPHLAGCLAWEEIAAGLKSGASRHRDGICFASWERGGRLFFLL